MIHSSAENCKDYIYLSTIHEKHTSSTVSDIKVAKSCTKTQRLRSQEQYDPFQDVNKLYLLFCSELRLLNVYGEM